MANLTERLRNRGRKVGREVKLRVGGSAAEEMAALRDRVEELEAEVQENRQLNLRLAELVDVVQELLLPVSQRDDAKVAELMERYTKSLG